MRINRLGTNFDVNNIDKTGNTASKKYFKTTFCFVRYNATTFFAIQSAVFKYRVFVNWIFERVFPPYICYKFYISCFSWLTGTWTDEKNEGAR